MCKKLIYLVFAVFVLGLSLVSRGAEDPNLVGWWRFNEGSGTIATDSSGNERHGILVDGPQWVDGIHGSGLELDGGQHVAVPGYEGILGSHPRSTCAWINVGKTSASIITWGPAGSGTKWVMRTHNGPAALRVECGQSYIYGTTDLVDGEWHHVAAVLEDDGSPDVEEIKLYVDGVVDETGAANPRPVNTASGVELRIAYDLNNTGRTYQGLMDDVRIYDRALSAEEIQALIENPGGTVTQALRPEPADGALHEDTWAILRWLPGDFAVSHDVYIGENFDDVNDGLESTFQGNLAAASITLGFPGFAFPDGLVPGTTYYWRIDEVNEAEPDSPWKGNVWSFMVPPKTAYNPIPPDGAKFVDPNGLLSWTAGSNAKLHTVYFGDNFDDVNDAAGGAPQVLATYDAGPLEAGKTYYWRVDESDAQTVHKGKVWSFTTTTPGGGLKGEYYNNMTLSGLPVLTRIDAGVDFNFGAGSPEAGVVNEDGFSVRWRGEIEAVFSEDYTFYTRTDDGSRLWLNDQLIIDKWAWVNTVADARSKPIRLAAGERYSIRMEWYNEDGNAEAHLIWESASQPKGAIPAAALSLPVRASGANPSNGAVDVKQIKILKWTPGDEAASHQVYFGTDQEAVRNADTSSPEYKGSRELGFESYDPGKLEWDTNYYWRIDEVNSLNSESPWVGNVWSFTTANFLIIDDFEDYDTGDNQIWFAWRDGLGFGTPGTDPYYAGNGTGSAVGVDDTPSYTEETIVHGGRKSMPYYYDNSILRYSEAQMTLTYPRDWTEKGVNRLTIWFRGNSDNAVEPMYVVLNGSAVVFHDNPNATQVGTWTEWDIDLQAFADQGVNLANVDTIGIGFGDRDNPQAGGSGTMYFDDIGLYPPAEPGQ
jgi:hypothetical protein